jgi:succinate dehydrogenase flavin-adding protein (antitoxin of CptAB toxin-antitoxin module)
MLDNHLFLNQKESQIIASQRITNEDQFSVFLYEIGQMADNSNFAWRGMHEANMKLYNSCQRYFNKISDNYELDSYHNFIKNLVNYVWRWNNNTIQKYLENLKIVNDQIAIMSIMQHYGFPTPLLDFSDNPYIALFFSSKDDKFDDNEDDIKNYSSLYCINKDITTLNTFNKEYKISKNEYYNQFIPLFATPILLISKEENEFNIGLNSNIINQSGLLIYSNSPIQPIEEYLLVNDSRASVVCWNIHKKFNHRIRLHLDRVFNINSNY